MRRAPTNRRRIISTCDRGLALRIDHGAADAMATSVTIWPDPVAPARARDRDRGTLHDLSANQIAMTTRATMMVPHTAGVTRFELPLRGESLAAWSNFIWIPWPWKPIFRN
jgi:hypothetical protein